MIRKAALVLMVGGLMIAGCDKKEAEKAAGSVTSTLDKAAAGAKDAVKGAADEAAKKVENVASAAKDTAIAEAKKLWEPIKKEGEALIAKAGDKAELKGLVDSLKGEIGGLDKMLSEAGASDKWSDLVKEATAKFDGVKKTIAELTAKLPK